MFVVKIKKHFYIPMKEILFNRLNKAQHLNKIARTKRGHIRKSRYLTSSRSWGSEDWLSQHVKYIYIFFNLL